MYHACRCTKSRCNAYRTVAGSKLPYSFFGKAANMGFNHPSNLFKRRAVLFAPNAPSEASRRLARRLALFMWPWWSTCFADEARKKLFAQPGPMEAAVKRENKNAIF